MVRLGPPLVVCEVGLKALKGQSGVNARSCDGCCFTAASVGIIYAVTLSERLRMVDVSYLVVGSLRGHLAMFWVTFSECGELSLCTLRKLPTKQ